MYLLQKRHIFTLMIKVDFLPNVGIICYARNVWHRNHSYDPGIAFTTILRRLSLLATLLTLTGSTVRINH